MFLKLLFLLCLFVRVLADEPTIEEQWAEFKSKYGKSYTNAEEEVMRFKIFQENVKSVKEHNKRFEAGETTFTLGINEFADLTSEEFQKSLLGYRR